MAASRDKESTFKEEYLHYKYYVLVGNKSQGPYRMDELRTLSGFTLQTPMRRTARDEWHPAFTVMNMKAYFSSANDVKAWAQAAAQLDREKARRARKARGSGFKPLFGMLGFLALAMAGVLFYLQASGRFDVLSLIRSRVPYLQNLDQRPKHHKQS